VKVRFVGSFRPVSTQRLEFIQGYFAHVMQRQLPPGFLEQEGLVTEDTVQFWLPVQTSLIAAFRKEVPPSSEVCLFVIWLGALNDGVKLDWVFVVNEFDTNVTTCR